MKQYKTVNNVVGWITFAIAAVVYCMTIEPTASFWDCPEFITTGYKLEVGHPPGAPFFMLTANIFSQFVSDPSQVAYMVNIMSALLSAGCILFLFWSITHLTKKLVCSNESEMSKGQLITIIGSGLVGALAYTFSDTFWYSAVEGEVYAYSSLFTAVVFWLILKWEENADKPHSDRWLILIAYLTGLSIGVHLLNLLCIPAIVLVYYYKRKPQANLKGSIVALILSMILVAVVLYGIVPGVVKVGGWFELLFVNVFGMPFNTGLYVYIGLVIAAVVWGLYETTRNTNRKMMNIAFIATVALLGIPFYGHGFSSILVGIIILAIVTIYLFARVKEEYRISVRALNTSLLCLMMIMVGYSSYAVIVIRSTANTPMDQNSPEDIFTLGEYLGREQYGTRPLFYGQAYSSRVKYNRVGNDCMVATIDGAPVYQRKEKSNPNEKDSYELVRNKFEYEYAQNMLFPRMWSQQHAHYGPYGLNLYEEWLGGVTGKQVPYDECGRMTMVKMPTQWDNIKFFFSYQLNYMYWRYFMWNFAGRQNDIQGSGELEHGNWITGIPFIDNAMLGNQDLLPEELKNNKGHNVFYCLPLILGLIGLFWQAYRGDKGIKQFWIVFFLFFMTGIAIVLYLNQTPMQPRERDYAYAGSFYAFAIWIGMGVAGLRELLYKKMGDTPAAITASVLCLFVPIQMVSQTWDDHDRSGRYTCRDFGQNYLNSLSEKNAPIIFTNGDNDTFPLWYNQETEGVGTNVRVCNLSYLQTDWYIDQMKRPAYDSPSLPINWERINYVMGKNDFVRIRPEVKEIIKKVYQEDSINAIHNWGEDPFEVKNIMKNWVCSDNPELNFIPTDTLTIHVDKEAVLRSGMYIPDSCEIPDKMYISLKGRDGLTKVELMMLEILTNTNWERPVYMSVTVGSDSYLGLGDYFIQEGLAYRFTPFNWTELGYAAKNHNNVLPTFAIDSDKMYYNMMHKFKFGGIDNPNIYLDETVAKMCNSHRRLFVQLASQLLREGKNEKALKVLNYCEERIPSVTVPHDNTSGSMIIAQTYAALGEHKKANKIAEALANKSIEYLTYYLSLGGKRYNSYSGECQYQLHLLDNAIRILANDPQSKDVAAHYYQKLNELFSIWQNKRV